MDNFSLLLTYVIPSLVAILFGVIGFQIRNLYSRIDKAEVHLRTVEIDLATNSEQNRGLMLRLDQIGGWCDSIEKKLDRVITELIINK